MYTKLKSKFKTEKSDINRKLLCLLVLVTNWSSEWKSGNDSQQMEMRKLTPKGQLWIDKWM